MSTTFLRFSRCVPSLLSGAPQFNSKFSSHRTYSKWLDKSLDSNLFNFTPEVSRALQSREPLVALESTIITHGMPYPQNLQTALKVEEIVRSKGAVPATIAILRGKICVGLSGEQLEDLATLKEPCLKTSRRDFPYVLSKGLNGGTTVSGTMLVASKIGIPVFVTGGIGGVHRGAESSLDISADLTELGRTAVAVISSGVKSILDIEKTLEYLETQGVCVASYGASRDFPAFFTSRSGFRAPYNVSDARQAAGLIFSSQKLKTGSGLLIAVPIPERFQAQGEAIEAAVCQALAEARAEDVRGKDVTPFLLKRVSEITRGASLTSNMALIENNAAVGAEIAVELSRFRVSEKFSPPPVKSVTTSVAKSSQKKCVVIGGSIVDFVASVGEESIKMDGSTHRGSIRQSYGGVGRNLADGLSRLGASPLFLTSVGDDEFGRKLVSHNPLMDTRGVCYIPGLSTATYVVILDRKGDFQFGIGDMGVHDHLTKDWVRQFESDITRSSLVVMDGNTPQETIDDVLDLCNYAHVPIWYEPTDVNKAAKPLKSPSCKMLAYASPNLAELHRMALACGFSPSDYKPVNLHDVSRVDEIEDQIFALCRPVMDKVHCLVVTLGKLGFLVVQRGDSNLPLAPWHPQPNSDGQLTWKHYPAPPIDDVVSVSGAGDCLAAGFVRGILLNWDQDKCAALGLKAAEHSLREFPAVPDSITPTLANF